MSTEPRKRLFVPLGTRLAVPLVLLVAAVAVVAYFGLVRTARVTAMQSKEAAADMVVKLTSLSVMPAVVFADDVEMQRAVGDVARNPDVIDVELWGTTPDSPSGSPLAAFHRKLDGAIGKPTGTTRIRRVGTKSLDTAEPIISPDGDTVGMLLVRFSTAREVAALERLSRQILLVSVGSALCFIIALWLVLRRLVIGPIQKLQSSAQRLAKGGEPGAPTHEIAKGRLEDEVSRLADAFGEMADAVRDREERLGVRNAELRLILDSVEQGFLTLRPDGTLFPERSAVIEKWLGELPEHCAIWDLAERIDKDARGWTEMAWQQVADELLPLPVALDQLPKRLVSDGCHFDFAYHPVMNGDRVDRMVVVLTDVTAEVERQRAIAEQHEFSVLVDQFVRDRRAFHDFWEEASRLVKRIVEEASPQTAERLRRDLHTLKGNARYFGLTRVSDLCHSLEDAIQARGEKLPTTAELESLQATWNALKGRMDPIIRGATAFVEISEDDYRLLLEAVAQRVDYPTIEQQVRGLRYESTEWRLQRAQETLATLAKRLGKGTFDVTIEHNDLRLPPGQFAPFWSVFPHLLNNAADHGIESDEERRAAGKPVCGRLRLSTTLEGGRLIIEVEDDGAGIDWDAIREKAKRVGLPYEEPADLEAALLSDGLSLKREVTDVSGRGVGLSAVSKVVTALGGRVEVQSMMGKGTTWRIFLPGAKVTEDLLKRRIATSSIPPAARTDIAHN